MIYRQLHLTLPNWLDQWTDLPQQLDSDEAMVELAVELSRRNVLAGSGGPFGAVIVDGSGRLLGVGVNRVVPQHCSVAHAEMMAFMTSQQRLQNFRLNADGRHITLATSSQPCSMCYGASIWAGIDRMLIGARASDVESLTEFDEGPLPADWAGELRRRGIEVITDVAREAACKVLADYGSGGGVKY
jgi:tRNA(Arg) A34 adenosine deaminase TadA